MNDDTSSAENRRYRELKDSIDHSRTALKPHYKSEVKCKGFVMKISFHSYANKTNFHMKSFALSLALIGRFTATWKWPMEMPKDTGHGWSC